MNIDTQQLLQEMSKLHEHIKEQDKHPKDTSKDGVYFIDTEEGSCVEIIKNGISVLMSLDMYQALINSKEIQEKYSE